MRDIPVILICYNRPWHTAQVLKALLEHGIQNLYIFSDAPKSSRDVEGVLKTRELFKAIRWTKPKIIERNENYGLARSIVSAVNHVFEGHDRLVLLEDDCVPRKHFFDFMKECLERYENHDRVFGINGYTVPIAEDLLSDYPFDIYFYPRIGSWGWATWKSAWMHYEPDLRKVCEQIKVNDIDINQGGTDIPQNVQKLINGEIKDVWTLNWVLSVYLNKGYYIYPTFSQIRNIGFDGTGLHCGETHKFDNFCVDYKPRRFPDDIIINEGLINNYNDYFGNPNKKPEVVSRQTIQHNFIAEPHGTKHNCSTANAGKLSIVHINTHDQAGGAAKVAWRLAEAQRNAGCDSIMLVGEKRSDSKYSFAFPVEADRSLRIQCRQQGQLYYEFQGSHKLVNNQHVLSADILHLHNLHGDFFNPSSLSSLSHLKPTVWTLHDQQPTTGHCAYSLDCQRWEDGCGQCPMLSLYPDILIDTSAQLYRDKKLIYDNSYLNIVVPSQWLKDNVQRSILRNHPVELIYNGIDTNIFRPYNKIEARKKLGIPTDVLVIGAVAHGGALENPWKGGNYTRAVFDALQTKLPDHIFVNIGGNSKLDSSRIISIPHINDESELAQAYSMLDIFLYTPAADNCPLVVLEALSCGIPIVTFDTGGVPELVRNGLDGYVSPYKDVHGLVQALEKLAAQTQLRAEFSRNARQEAIAKFDHKKIAQQYQELYERCLQQRKSEARKVKLLPLAAVPKVILNRAFIKAESTKKVLDYDAEKKREAKCHDNFKVSRDNELVIATSISPKNLAKQVKAVESWVKLGFDVVSINCAEEIQKLQGAFPDVKFIQAKRDAREMFGKPFIYFDDFLEYFLRTDSEICGIVNSDILLIGDKGIVSFIKEEAADSLVYGPRINVDSLERLDGKFFNEGFDFFFFPKIFGSFFQKSCFCVGMPWWDYWMPLILILEGISVKKLTSPFAYHIKHSFRWNGDQGKLLINKCFEYLQPKLNDNFNSNPDTNQWAFLARMLKDYHDRDVRENNRTEKDRISPDVFYYCIFDFLKIKSSEISYAGSEPTTSQIDQSKKKKDIFIHKDALKAQNADYLHADYDVSIVICTKDRAELLDQMFASLEEAAKCVAYEVIVIEGGSTDNTLDVLRKYKVTKVYSESEWLGPGRHSWPQLYNFGFSKATGKWAMYASDDIIFSKEAISWAFRTLSSQSDKVAGGIFFYKNIYCFESAREWASYGIDFTHGQKLLMNYGLIRLDYFHEVGGLEEVYQFYCADSDLCYKLYERGKQLIPLPASFIAHNNVLDAQKKVNYSTSGRDIELLRRRWKHFVPMEIPEPRRLVWQEDLFEALNLMSNLGKVNYGIGSFWHGLAYFQQELFEKAKSKFIQAIESHCEHWLVHWLLAKAAYQCGDKALAEKMVLQVLKQAPTFGPAKDFLNQLSAEVGESAELVQCQTKSENRLSPIEMNTRKDMVGLIFSKDRAMQLQAALESFFLHCTDSEQIKLFVLYQVSNHLHQRQYNNLKKDFGNITFIKETNFKQQLCTIVEGSEYVLFLVDDNLFVKDFSLADVVKSLQGNKDAIGFSLRLGKNTDYCYSHDSKQNLPVFQGIDNGILKYNWTAGEYDFGYPLELSSSLYRTSDILILLDKLEFTHPNILEDMMAANSQLYAQTKDFLLCYENSVAFCNPINKVQSVWNNRSCTDDRYSAERLAEMFEDGVRIDVEKFSGFVPNSCHQEVQVYFKTEERGQKAADRRWSPEREVSPPKFSIVMANYNKEKYIAEAIESVLNQTFTDWELIIIDDCSTDDSLNVIQRYLDDTRIKLIQHKKNRGKTAALKAGIANVRSEYFGILDSDDCLLPNAVETMYAYHEKFPDCGLVYSQFAYCHQDLTRRCVGFCDKIPAGKTALDLNVVSHFQTFKLCDYLKTSGYDENILYAEDIDIVYKVEEVTSLKFMDECLYLYRELPTSICHSKDKINVAIMSRVKARINALKRRCDVLAESGNKNFEDLFAQAVKQARTIHKDVEQYFVILAKLYENNLLSPDLNLPVDIERRDVEERLLWLAANVDIKFDKLFELLAGQGETEKQPLVTVYIVAYNAEKFIAQAIDSVLSQVYKNFELLIVDDGSTDKTKELVASYSDDRIHYIYKEHKNYASGVNRVIAEAKGKYIMVVDSDDFIAPDYIEKIVAFAEKHPQIDYFYPAQLTLVNESGDPTGQQWSYMDFSDNSVLPSFLFKNGYGPIPNPGSLKRKTLFDKVGLYDEVDTVEDFVFLCKNALKINFKRVDEHSTYFYRRHRQSNSLKFEARNRIMADVLNEMVSIYPAEVLYPQVVDISDAGLKEQQYYKYVVETFCRHANGPMVQFGQYFQKYAVYYKSKLLRITGPKQLVPK